MGLLSSLFGPKEPDVVPVRVTDENFEAEVFKSELPVLLDVWGPHCAPCRQLEPIILRLARKYAGRVKVAEMNSEGAPRATMRLGVRATPTVIYYRGRVEVERVVGVRGELYHSEVIGTDLLPAAERAAKEKDVKAQAGSKSAKRR